MGVDPRVSAEASAQAGPGRPSKDERSEWLNAPGGASGLRLIKPYGSESGQALTGIHYWLGAAGPYSDSI